MASNFGFQPDVKDGEYFYLSYNTEDSQRIAPIALELHKMGVPLWYDYGLKIGKEWEEQIADRIRNCKAIVLFITNSLFAKDRPFTEVEYKLAEMLNKKTYIVMLDKIDTEEIPTRYRVWWVQISMYQWCVDPTADKIARMLEFKSHAAPLTAEPDRDELAAPARQDLADKDSVNYSTNDESERYDVFISFKCMKLDGSGEKTRDYELAKELFEKLRDDGVSVFFSEKDIHDSDFSAAIDQALDEAKVLIAVGTCLEHITSGRVEYEWDSFADDITEKRKSDGQLFSYLEGMSARELPRKLRRKQSYTPDTKNELISAVERHVASTPQSDAQPARDSYYRDADSDGKLGKDTQVGDYVEFGHYPQQTNGKDEPLSWRVLDVQDGKALLITEDVIDCCPYNEKDKSQERGGNTWEFSELRAWANAKFLVAAFSRKERRIIKESHNANDGNCVWENDGGSRTGDWIFFLSIEEAEKYFGQAISREEVSWEKLLQKASQNYIIQDEKWQEADGLSREKKQIYIDLLEQNLDRSARPTNYAKNKGCDTSRMLGTSKWWLRSPGKGCGKAAYVDSNGSISSYGANVDDSNICVRPACWVKL